VDGFSNDYKKHLILSHAYGPDIGPWVGIYSVLAINDRSVLYSGLHGIVTGTYSSPEIALAVASEHARRRVDDFLVQRAVAAMAR
jgi:hypothetical protein